MALEGQDAAYLWDMLEAAKEAVEILGALDVKTFKQDKIRCRAVERTLEIIGEAARRVSPKYQTQHPEIPWRDMIGQRNILAHEYGQIDHELLYKTIREDIPKLISVLSQLLPSTD
jgi:uncharacterized protein with HEPN domain